MLIVDPRDGGGLAVTQADIRNARTIPLVLSLDHINVLLRSAALTDAQRRVLMRYRLGYLLGDVAHLTDLPSS